MQRAKSLSLDLYLCTHMPSNIDIGFGHAIISPNSPIQAGGWWPDGENNTGRESVGSPAQPPTKTNRNWKLCR